MNLNIFLFKYEYFFSFTFVFQGPKHEIDYLILYKKSKKDNTIVS